MKKTSDSIKFHQRALTLIMFLMIFASIAIALKLEKVGPIFHKVGWNVPYHITPPVFSSFNSCPSLPSEATDDRKQVSIQHFVN